MPPANVKRDMAARMTAEDCEPEDRIVATLGVSVSTIEHWLKQIDEIRTGVAHKEAVVNPCSYRDFK